MVIYALEPDDISVRMKSSLTNNARIFSNSDKEISNPFFFKEQKISSVFADIAIYLQLCLTIIV